MKYWFVQKPVCKNWWYNQIGIPRTLGPAFLLFETEMTEKEKQEAIRVMEQSQFGMTGQNKVWLAGNVLIRGLLLNDTELIKEARENICSEIVLGQKEDSTGLEFSSARSPATVRQLRTLFSL